MDQPIACSLDATELGTQLDEWRAVLGAEAATVLDGFIELASL